MEAGRLSPEAAGARLSELFEEHGRMVYGVCRVLLRNADEAEDAAQQAFLSAHRSMLGGTDPRDPAAWLGTIARNECHARMRARLGTPLALVEERDAVAADVEQVAGQHAEIEALCAALAELPQQQREALVLREFYGLSYEEVRAALGLTDAAVESLIFRARKRLQDELRPARVASGALALPLALRDTLAAAVPGFGAGSSGGVLAKLGSLPLLAKLAGAAATLTAAGTIGYVGLDARDHSVANRPRPASSNHAARTPSNETIVRHELTPIPVVSLETEPTSGRRESGDDESEDDGGAEAGESEREVEDTAPAGDQTEDEPEAESTESDSDNGGSGGSGGSGED